MTTAARQLIEQGRRDGERQGRIDGSREMLRRLLVVRFTALDARSESRLGAGSLEELQRWAERMLSATSLDAVFED